jgi:hypothetical protein
VSDLFSLFVLLFVSFVVPCCCSKRKKWCLSNLLVPSSRSSSHESDPENRKQRCNFYGNDGKEYPNTPSKRNPFCSSSSNALRLPVKHHQTALQHIHTLLDLLLTDRQTRDEPHGLFPARKNEDPPFPHELDDALDVRVGLEGETEDETATAGRAGDEAGEEGGEGGEAGLEGGTDG